MSSPIGRRMARSGSTSPGRIGASTVSVHGGIAGDDNRGF
jgi:hypothetical protein